MTKEEFKSKAKSVKDDATLKLRNSWYWCINNKDTIIALTPVALGAMGLAGKAIKSASNRAEMRHEDKKRNLTIYDPSTGVYLNLRRPLTTDEKVALAYKPKDSNVTQVLDTFGVLK